MNAKKDFQEVFGRLQSFDITTQQDLASILGINQSAIADAKKRGSFPRKWAEKLGEKFNKPIDFLLSGRYNNPGIDLVPSSLSEIYERLLTAEKENNELRRLLREQEILLAEKSIKPL